MPEGGQTLYLVSDFNLDNFANILRSRTGGTRVIRTAPLDQVVPFLASTQPDAASQALVWTRPEHVSTAVQAALNFQPLDMDLALREADEFADVVLGAAKRWQMILVPQWQLPGPVHSGPGELSYSTGLRAAIMRMNLRLAERIEHTDNIQSLNSGRWIEQAGPKAWSKPLWYLSKTPFSKEVFHAAAGDLQAFWDLAAGHAIKMIVLDLDDTLWGGIVGDDGWQNLRLGGHDPVGESFADFQKALKGLKERGIMLAIASKNEENTALEAMEKHPEMILKKDDFVAMRINWNDKAANIREMVGQLNIGEQSVMFIDDNPVERSRVQAALPEVLVPDWPVNKLLYVQELRRLNVFNLGAVSGEDVRRTAMYQEEALRERSKENVGDLEGWLHSLGMKVTAQQVQEADFARVHQLFLKTNQFNLATRRPTESELRNLVADPGREFWALRVADKFGDSGLTGVLGMDFSDGTKARITDMILSCRVMGRRVEETLLHLAWARAKAHGKQTVEAVPVPTERNKPCLDFLQRSGMAAGTGGQTFTRRTEVPYELPPTIQLITPARP